MILAALAAAALAAPPANDVPARAAPPPIVERMPNLYRPPERCKDATVKIVDRFGRPVAEKLGDLPQGALIYAVDRRQDGGPVLMVAYGTAALDNPNPPPAAKQATPAKREDAPSNRR